MLPVPFEFGITEFLANSARASILTGTGRNGLFLVVKWCAGAPCRGAESELREVLQDIPSNVLI